MLHCSFVPIFCNNSTINKFLLTAQRSSKIYCRKIPSVQWKSNTELSFHIDIIPANKDTSAVTLGTCLRGRKKANTKPNQMSVSLAICWAGRGNEKQISWWQLLSRVMTCLYWRWSMIAATTGSNSGYLEGAALEHWLGVKPLNKCMGISIYIRNYAWNKITYFLVAQQLYRPVCMFLFFFFHCVSTKTTDKLTN